jgi:hypothetical protein
MRCVVHVRRSFDLCGQHFVLRLYPEFMTEKRRSESFTSAQSLVERLEALGVPRMDPGRSFPDDVGGLLDAMWTNIEVPQNTFESFGKNGSRSSSEDSPVAA